MGSDVLFPEMKSPQGQAPAPYCAFHILGGVRVARGVPKEGCRWCLYRYSKDIPSLIGLGSGK